jgi:hypothetical protein
MQYTTEKETGWPCGELWEFRVPANWLEVEARWYVQTPAVPDFSEGWYSKDPHSDHEGYAVEEVVAHDDVPDGYKAEDFDLGTRFLVAVGDLTVIIDPADFEPELV